MRNLVMDFSCSSDKQFVLRDDYASKDLLKRKWMLNMGMTLMWLGITVAMAMWK